MNLVEYPDREMMMMDLADKLASDLRQSLSTGDAVSFAVPGGTTPGPLFDTLSAVRLDWDRVTVLLGDERWVPETSDRSNARLVRRRLMRGYAAAASFLFFHSEADDPSQALGPVCDALTPLLPLSVLVLGMGADMHTASLFPGSPELEAAIAADAPPVMAVTAPGQPEPRVTLTGPVLRGAMHTHVVITGPEKRAAVEQAAKLDDPLQAPVSLVLKDATVHWAE
ncbi:6-phosphogluconolactonase [Meridianimarinicoccus roseus]|uniref:6-phosphogluconolactonase n=1 Tax=Meridianimarinicoccus roseus TaxID=2072018 RepID=A0A2V2LB35_9RHOB|nr:6-phosphogluconolactonase [Meridianimarinicoccus roseus]PWR00891.1 6-phosphogluconolactonase [Meridianimarinicoccus roseus]